MTLSFRRLELPLASIICLLALTRLLPHWPNATPVLAVALAGGALFTNRLLSFAVPMLAMVVSDAALGLISGWEYSIHSTQVFVYACVLATIFVGYGLRNAKYSMLVVLGGTVSSVMFFIVTNAAVWMQSSIYPHTVEGLIACYIAGLAFYRDSGSFFFNLLASTWLFTGAIVVAHKTLKSLIPQGLSQFS